MGLPAGTRVWQRLNRQAQQYARESVPLSESTMCDWVGSADELVRPLIDALRRYVFSADSLHTDDTSIAVLSPNGKPPDERRVARQTRAAPIVTGSHTWLENNWRPRRDDVS